jgi:probable HAF family extracellular repeat protein
MTRECIVPARRRAAGLCSIVVATLASSAALPRAAAATTYKVTIVKNPDLVAPSVSLPTTGDAINANGDIVGLGDFTVIDQNQVPRTAFKGILVKGGVLTDLGDLDNDANVTSGGSGSRAVALNGSDQIVGWSYTFMGELQRPVLWQNGKIQDLGIFTVYPDVESTNINTAGQIVGFATGINGDPSFPTLAWLFHNGSVTTLPTLGGLNAEAWGINDVGQIVGAADVDATFTHACVWHNGTVRDLGALPGAQFSEAVAINASGVAVGFSTVVETVDGFTEDFGDRRAVVFQNGKVTNLTPDVPSFNDAHASAINTAGLIVGDKAGRAFLWRNGVGTDLNTLIPSNAGVVLLSANGINDKGQIAATAVPTGSSSNTVGVLLTPL